VSRASSAAAPPSCALQKLRVEGQDRVLDKRPVYLRISAYLAAECGVIPRRNVHHGYRGRAVGQPCHRKGVARPCALIRAREFNCFV
jgi:hypothetical protein